MAPLNVSAYYDEWMFENGSSKIEQASSETSCHFFLTRVGVNHLHQHIVVD